MIINKINKTIKNVNTKILNKKNLNPCYQSTSNLSFEQIHESALYQ